MGTDEANAPSEPLVPRQQDTLATIAAVADIAIYEGYPRIDWVAAKLGLTRRSLQRRLRMHGTSFNGLVEATILRRSRADHSDRA